MISKDQYFFCDFSVRRSRRIAVVLLATIVGSVGCGTLDARRQGGPGARAGETRYFAGMPFVWCPPGAYLMGKMPDEASPPEWLAPNSETRHKVRISKGFWLGKYEVTQAQWQEVMKNNPSKFTGNRRLPVDSVSWEDCQEFLFGLFHQTHMRFRLPSDAEWEYACRAGSTEAFCFGDSNRRLDQVAWYTMNSSDRTHPVGAKTPNAWGLFDMHGNVAEWCRDYYGQMNSGDVVDPTGREAGFSRVIRGGSWGTSADYCLSAFRACARPDVRDSNIGLRIICHSTK